MATLMLTIPDALLSEALTMTVDQEITLDDFVVNALQMALELPDATVQSAVSIEEVLQQAIAAARLRPLGETFFVKDLCDRHHWESLTGGDRKKLGKAFKRAVETAAPPVAKHIGRNSANQAIYKKV